MSHEKPEVFVLIATYVGIEEIWRRPIVKGGQQIGVHVVHGLALQQILRETKGFFVALPHPFPPVLENGAYPYGGVHFCPEPRNNLWPYFLRKSQNHFGKVFVRFRGADATGKFTGILRGDGLKIEVPFSDENCSGNNAIPRHQGSEGPFLKLECRRV